MLVGKKEKQSVYTGKQQRGSIFTLPFIKAGLFRPMSARSTATCAPLPDSCEDVVADGLPDLAAAAIRRGGGTAQVEPDGGDESASGYEADSDEDGAAVKQGAQFDRGAFNLAHRRSCHPYFCGVRCAVLTNLSAGALVCATPTHPDGGVIHRGPGPPLRDSLRHAYSGAGALQ